MDTTVSDKVVKDMFGVEISVGDLVVTNGRVGMVSGFNAHGSVNVRVRTKRNVYAWELGAPDVEAVGRQVKRDARGGWVRSTVPGEYYVYEDYTYTDKDRRVIDETDAFYTIVRQNTRELAVLRKIDGTKPSPFSDAIERHEKIFPAKETGDTSPDMG